MSHEQTLFSVANPDELLALWRLVAEAKFQADPDDKDLWGSPFVHNLAQRISDALLQTYKNQHDVQAIEAHHRWIASLPTNIVLSVVKARLRNDASSSWWHSMSHEQKLEYVQGCVSPFEPDQNFIELLVHEAET